MTRIRIPAPDIEADVSAEQVVEYLLGHGSGWTEAINLSAHWRTFKMGLCSASVPRSAFVDHRLSETIDSISRAEQRHPSAVLHDIVGPAAGVAGRGCRDEEDRATMLSRGRCHVKMAGARYRAEQAAARADVETDDDGAHGAEESEGV